MNKFLRFLLTLFIVMSLFSNLSTAIDEVEIVETIEIHDNSLLESQETSLRGAGRFLAQQNYRATMTCDKYPKICQAKGSQGQGKDCCKKKCVNLISDRLNCGVCGKKCKFGEICCNGKCVNPLNDKKNCGGCNKKCATKGDTCVQGMCNYSYA